MEEILRTNIPREKGYLYFLKGDPLSVCKAEMARRKKSKDEDEEE